jgi:hypothetical protein
VWPDDGPDTDEMERVLHHIVEDKKTQLSDYEEYVFFVAQTTHMQFWLNCKKRIQQLLAGGLAPGEVARRCNCGLETVVEFADEAVVQFLLSAGTGRTKDDIAEALNKSVQQIDQLIGNFNRDEDAARG